MVITLDIVLSPADKVMSTRSDPRMRDHRALRNSLRLAPLHLFRAFEAAAKHVSFTLAAEDLCVTQSAISQQVRQLEQFLGVPLFRRLPRRLELTREGIILAGSVQEALFMIQRACERLADASPAVLIVSATPSLAARWLLPRLGGLMERHPGLRVTLLASDDAVDFARQDVDVAIRWGRDHWPGMRAEPLAPGSIVPVCSPALIAHLGLPASPRDLERFTLLETANSFPWADWCEAAGFNGFSFEKRLYFSDFNLMLEAAVHGQGLCLTSSLVVERDIEARRLVPMLQTHVQVEERFHVLMPWHSEKPAVALFREWLVEEAKSSTTSSTESSAIVASPGRLASPR